MKYIQDNLEGYTAYDGLFHGGGFNLLGIQETLFYQASLQNTKIPPAASKYHFPTHSHRDYTKQGENAQLLDVQWNNWEK